MIFSERLPIYESESCMTISGGRTEEHVVIGFGAGCSRLEYVDIRSVY